MLERRTTTHALDRGLAERNRVIDNLHAQLRRPNCCRREEWRIVVEVSREKIVDVVFAGIDSCHERSPSYRRNRRECRAQVAKCFLVAQLSETGQFPYGDESAS